ncbi:unnamed protein product [Miscanthus lutarioriparius]|uniref:Uncharacterized protein n=1 Tax=Miscanthus lutarioriparius TaxID=422564 RepID=A0A811SDG2_9POAL|nr:unnamed protein product [Miscanthus lutarioriparius]
MTLLARDDGGTVASCGNLKCAFKGMCESNGGGDRSRDLRRIPKRRLDEILGGQAKPKRRHLYLVLDDWSSGYSIRKIDLSADLDPFYPARPVAAARRWIKRRLPPAIFRFQAQRELTRCFAASFDSILAMLPVCLDPPRGAHVFNVHKRTGRPFDEDTESPESDSEESGSRRELESWKLDVTSYAVHSGEHSLFVSTQDSTFVYSTVDVLMGGTEPFQWDRRRSQCVLPFTGRGHFDSELQAWIGLSREFTGRLCSCEVFSAYPYPDVEVEQSPAVKISKEERFVLHPHEKLVGATLISCGVRSYYCLVQCVSVDEKLEEQSMSVVDELQKQSISVDKKLVEEQSMSVDEKLEEQSISVDEKLLEEQSASLLRLLTFYVQYDKNGDLTVGDRQIRDYSLPESVSEQVTKNPIAFWI